MFCGWANRCKIVAVVGVVGIAHGLDLGLAGAIVRIFTPPAAFRARQNVASIAFAVGMVQCWNASYLGSIASAAEFIKETIERAAISVRWRRDGRPSCAAPSTRKLQIVGAARLEAVCTNTALEFVGFGSLLSAAGTAPNG